MINSTRIKNFKGRGARMDASLLYSVDRLIEGATSQPLTVIQTDTLIQIYERGGCAEDFDDRLVMVIRRDVQRGTTYGVLRHSSREWSWSFGSKTEIDRMARDAASGEFTSIDEFCKSLGRTDEQVAADREQETGLSHAERMAKYWERVA